jgi:hypothetical protein
MNNNFHESVSGFLHDLDVFSIDKDLRTWEMTG